MSWVVKSGDSYLMALRWDVTDGLTPNGWGEQTLAMRFVDRNEAAKAVRGCRKYAVWRDARVVRLMPGGFTKRLDAIDKKYDAILSQMAMTARVLGIPGLLRSTGK